MTTEELLALVRPLPERSPITNSLTEALIRRAGGSVDDRREVWYDTQKEHLLGFVGAYNTPGAYGRANPGRDAKFFYNHGQCAEMLLWLAEAAGVPRDELVAARDAVLAAKPSLASQCAALRRVIPWARVEQALLS